MTRRTGFILAIVFSGSLLFAADDMFPDIPGWKLGTDHTVYVPGNLWELINGAAELYLAYDFQDLHMASYADKKGREVRVELYHHSSPENTYGIYTAERMPDYDFIEMGTQGYTGPGILHFFTGSYYVKVLSYGSADAGEETLKTIAGRVAAWLKQGNRWPDEIKLFPEEGKVPASEAYFASNFMGYSFLRSSFTARYTVGGEFTLFIIHGKAGEAEAMLNRYKGLIKEDKIEQRGDIVVIQDMFNGKVIMSLQGDYLVGVMNAADEGVAVACIGKVVERITGDK